MRIVSVRRYRKVLHYNDHPCRMESMDRYPLQSTEVNVDARLLGTDRRGPVRAVRVES